MRDPADVSRILSTIAAAGASLVAAFALLGWGTGIQWLTGPFPGGALMMRNTALLLLLSGCAALMGHRRRLVRDVLGLTVCVAAALTLAQDLTGINLGIDELVGADRWSGGALPGRMAPGTAVSLIIFGASLTQWTRARGWSYGLAIAGMCPAGVALVGYLYGVDGLYRPVPFAAMSSNTAVALTLLGVALLGAESGQGLTALLVDRGLAGMSTRRLLPAALAAPVVVGWLRLQGQRAGWYDTEFGLSLMVISTGILLVGLVWMTGRALVGAQASARGEEKLRAFLHSAPDAIVIVGTEGRIVLVNSQAEGLFGYPREEMLGAYIEMLVPQRFHAGHVGHRTGYIGAPNARPMGSGRRLFGRRKDGSEVPVEISLSPIDTDEGVLISAAIRDVTDRRQIEQKLEEKNVELEQAILAKDRFLTSMSHELRTPLNGVIGFTGTLLMRLPGPLTADQESQLRMVQSSAKHLLSLINDLLDLAKIQSGRVEIYRERVSCREVLDEVVSTLAPLAAAKGLSFAVDDLASAPVLNTDRRALTQIVINLVSNAIKFTERGSVRILLEESRGDDAKPEVRITVEDTGLGISEADLTRLFRPFEQLDTGTARRHEGTGLGLHLSQKLVALLGGGISLESTLGVGSRFTVTLPVEG